MNGRFLLAVPAAVAAIAIAAGCSGGGGGGGGGGNSFTGTIHGNTFAPTSAVWATLTLSTSGGGQHAALVLLADTPDFCNEITAGRIHQNAKLMELLFADFSGSTISPPSAPGTYTEISFSGGGGVPPPKLVAGAFAMLDTSCNSISASSAQSTSGGSVDLTTVNASTIGGHGTLVWDSGDSGAIQLDATNCPGLATAFGGSTQPTCVP